MYKELRPNNQNTPDGWSEILAGNRLQSWKFALDPRWKLIRRYLTPPVLDAGCGMGEWVSFLNSRGVECAGLDFSRKMIERNRSEWPKYAWIEGETQHIPAPDNAFNAIISWGVIEHDYEGPERALQEFYRILRPHGRLLVTVPVDTPYQRRASQAQFPSGDTFFQYFYSQEELNRAIVDAGFRLVAGDFCSRPHPSLIWPSLTSKIMNGPLWRTLQLGALAFDRKYGNMIYALGEKVDQEKI